MNHSANFGVEGVTDDPDVIAAREQAAMNMIGMLLLSLGTPMMLAGDEFRNTQDGNNNAYCQDNDITWLKWDWMYSTNKTREMRRLETVSRLVALRKSLDLYHHEDFFTRLTQIGLLKPSSRVQWFLPDGTTPMERDWFDLAYVASPCDCCPTVRWTCALWSTAPLTTAHSACRQTPTGRLNGARPKSTAAEPGMALRSRNAI